MCGARPENDAAALGVPDEMPVTGAAAWKPNWMVDLGDGDRLGIAVDDGCFVVLYPHGDAWRPGTHIPKEVAARIAKLVNTRAID